MCVNKYVLQESVKNQLFPKICYSLIRFSHTTQIENNARCPNSGQCLFYQYLRIGPIRGRNICSKIRSNIKFLPKKVRKVVGPISVFFYFGPIFQYP